MIKFFYVGDRAVTLEQKHDNDILYKFKTIFCIGDRAVTLEP